MDYSRADFKLMDILDKDGNINEILTDDMQITNLATEKEVLKHGWKKSKRKRCNGIHISKEYWSYRNQERF